MDNQHQYILTFENGSAADANRWASELKEYILNATTTLKDNETGVEVQQRRDNPYSLDLGTTLSLVLGTPAVIAVAKAIGNWLALHRQASITIKTPQGEIIATKLRSEDTLRLAELLLAAKKGE
jgi:hypothetical protein